MKIAALVAVLLGGLVIIATWHESRRAMDEIDYLEHLWRRP